MLGRLGVVSLVVVVMAVAFLGFASGDPATHIWDKHPRHAGMQRASTPHMVWKTTPAVSPEIVMTAAPVQLVAVVPIEHDAVVAAPPRPPFVPPRV
jgi:hypothetical protein